MFVLRKKRILILMTLMCLVIIGSTVNVKNIKKESEKTVETVSLPVSNKVVVLDAGHRNS